MNQLRYHILLCCAFALLNTSCSKDDSEVLRPTVDESTIVCSVPSTSITFSADYPKGTKLKLLIRQLTNGNEEQLIDIMQKANNQTYYVSLTGLVGGSTYTYYVIGYDSNGTEVIRTSERTFTLPKKACPSAPITSGLTVHAPSSIIAADGSIEGIVLTLDIEYSTDDGQTWLPVTTESRITGLRPGKVLIRKAENPTTEASKTATIRVPEYKSNTDLDGTYGTSDGTR